MDSEFSKLGNYLQKISEIEKKCENYQKKLIAGEKEKSEIEEEIIKLDKIINQLNNDLENKASELGQAHAKISILKLENSTLLELKESSKSAKTFEENKLWEISQNVYSDIINYCDKVQAFTEKNNLTNMVKPYLYPYQEIDNRKYEEAMLMKNKKIKELKEINSKLKSELSTLNERNNEFIKLQERRTFLKYNLLKGKEFLHLQVALKESRDNVKALEAKVIEIERKKLKKEIPTPIEKKLSDAEVSHTKMEDCKTHYKSAGNSVKSNNESQRKAGLSCFVPKVPLRNPK